MAINYLDLPIGRKYPYEVDCVVEIGKDTNLKYEYDERLHVFRLDRCLLSSMSYPCTYGFIPSTKADDGDALDMLIYSPASMMTGTVCTCRVIGALDMTDGGKKDWACRCSTRAPSRTSATLTRCSCASRRTFSRTTRNWKARTCRLATGRMPRLPASA